jgi:hypothetical protein
MNTRLLLMLARWLALACASWLVLPLAHAQSGYTVTNAQMQEAVAQRFPRAYTVGGGLLELTLQAPKLRLLPEQNRLGSELVVDAAGPALARSASGTFDADFALRYEASDKSIRAYRLRFNSLRLSGLAPGPSALLQAYGPQLAEQALQEVVLHRLRPQDLALADNLGLEPGTITVTATGLAIAFVAKPRL